MLPENDRPDSESPQRILVSLGATLTQLGRKHAAWLEQWDLGLRQLNQAMEEIVRRLAPQVQALREWAGSPEVQRFAQGVVAWGSLLESAPSYCAPYDWELARLGLTPLAAEEQRHFMLVAVLLRKRRELRLGQRLPLVEVALAAGRLDITAALVMERAATRSTIRSLEMSNKREAGELLADAYVEMREKILPSIERRLHRIPLADMRRVARPVLEQVVRDAYLVKSIKRVLVRRLERERRRKEKEEKWVVQRSATEIQRLADAHRGQDQNWLVEQAIASFLERPRASALDRKLVAALRRRPESRAKEIAGRIGEPVRTVQYHYRKLVDHVRKQLEG